MGSTDNLCQFITTCGQSGVRSLKLGEFQVEFGPEPQYHAPEVTSVAGLEPAPGVIIDQVDTEIDKLAEEQDDRDELMILDPEEYERQELVRLSNSDRN